MAPERSEGATKGLRFINYVDTWVLKLDYSLVVVPFQLLVTTKHREIVVAISKLVKTSSANYLFYLTLTGSQRYGHAMVTLPARYR